MRHIRDYLGLLGLIRPYCEELAPLVYLMACNYDAVTDPLRIPVV